MAARLVLLAISCSIPLLLQGCSGCTAPPARAQGPDGGTVIEVRVRVDPVPVPVPVVPEPDPEGPASCWIRAQSRSTLVDTQIAALCTGAWNAGPVDCYRASRTPLLLWSSLCFVGLALNNALLFLDLTGILEPDLSVYRSLIGLASLMVLLYGLVWHTR